MDRGREVIKTEKKVFKLNKVNQIYHGNQASELFQKWMTNSIKYNRKPH